MHSTEMVPLTTLPELLTFTLLSTTTWLTLHLYVHRNGPIPLTRSVAKLNNRFYAAISLAMFLTVTLQTTKTAGDDSQIRYIYHLSKLYEFIDILLVCASGGPISLHFGFHHLTTPYLTFIRYLSGSEHWGVFAALNTFHHVLMYAYFGGAVFLRPILPWSGMLQLVGGLVVDLMLGIEAYTTGEDGEVWPYLGSGMLLGVYFILNWRDLRARRV
ncbi:hypothetical protein BJY04DRAFT_199455 [Aspergillus karnatakaensis]|uniref:uncharacterized protein n=1 Tax=Aspergillus karnatakaensis TaxID=1810916 RepID=UPI003CCDD611